MARIYEFIVGRDEAGLRLDHYLMRRVPLTISRRQVQEGVRGGSITVGGHAVKPNRRLRSGEVIAARFDQLPAKGTDIPVVPAEIPLDVVYEDDTLIVVNKPAGLVTHPAPGHWQDTLVNALVWRFSQQQATVGQRVAPGRAPVRPEPTTAIVRRGEDARGARRQDPLPRGNLPRAGIIHRLDKDTSGLLIAAKTPAAQLILSRQLKARRISRRYLALVDGHVPMDAGTIDAAIGRHRTHRKEMAIQRLGGRHAITHYRVLARFGPDTRRLELPSTLLELSLETGRTHQIRVHLAHLGHPVMGDVTYGRHPASFWTAHGIARQLLHAYAIRFLHPVTGQPVELRAPLPDDLRGWLSPDALEAIDRRRQVQANRRSRA